MIPTYELQVRDARSLELRGIIPDYADLWYERTAVEPGQFGLTVALDELPDATLAAAGALVVVLRDRVIEFAGIVEAREFNADARTWTLSGPDLLGFFGRRYWPTLAAANGPAETVAKGYISAHGLAAWQSELDPARTFEIQADQSRGEEVSISGRRGNLLTDALIPAVRDGDLMHTVELLPGFSGYRYRIDRPLDATAVTGARPLSIGWETVTGLVYREDRANLRNAVTALGSGTGPTRTQELVTDTASIAADFRREGYLDVRDGATAAELQAASTRDITTRQRQARRVEATPFWSEQDGGLEYRTDYDVGWDITVAIPETGIDSFTRRIETVRVGLDQEGEHITIQLGAPPPSLPAVLVEAQRRTAAAQFA